MRLILAWVVVNGLLMGPVWLSSAVADGPSPGWLALEAALLVGLLALLPKRPWSKALAYAAGFAVLLITVVGFASVVFQVSLARPLNLFIDLGLLRSVYDLAVGNIGLPMTIVAMVAIVVILSLTTWGLGRLLAPLDLEGRPALPRLAPRFMGIALIALFGLGLTHETSPVVQSRLATPVWALAKEQGGLLLLTWRERGRFRAEMASRPASYAGVPDLLGKLRDRDVMLTFIESYGMSALNDPQFAQTVGPRLDSLAARMAASVIQLASGRLTSSTQGGQSWLAHGSMISGLWLSSQPRYELLMANDRETLVDDFRHSGHRTIAVMPAIIMRWPEGERLRYDQVFTAPDIPYEGPPLYWVTMPDQFTWSFVEHGVRDTPHDKPLFVETALVSSHAPWVPTLPMVEWERIGNGAAFAPFRQDGHPPKELWIDTDQLRANYARSLDYSLQAMAEYAEKYLDDHTLLIVLGDHQAAPWVTNSNDPDVPVHVLARDRALIQPFLDWGFRAGAFPDPNQRERRMDQFRDWFVNAFSGALSAAAVDTAATHAPPAEGPTP
ncbi:MAG: sulfatase [Gemmatimonadetes bacterium]|nr:sulfatase [Gemmatimonadota bacterium]